MKKPLGAPVVAISPRISLKTRKITGILYTAMESVLVVESQAITRCCWADALRDRGYEVVEAENASEASERARLYAERLSALVVEVRFSDANAVTLVSEMKQRNPKLCVITSSTLRSCDLPTDLQYDAFLEKPANAKQVLAILDRLTRHGPQEYGCSN